MFQIVNMIEQAVTEAVDNILPTLPNVCRCERCRADVICLTLNQLPPRYVVNRWGEIMSEAEFESAQRKAEVIAAVMKSVRKIAGRPHDDRPLRPGADRKEG